MKINREKALEILHLVVDGEATPKQSSAFFQFIETDPDVKRQYESMLMLKKFIKSRYKRKNAPESLKNEFFKNLDQNLSQNTDLPSANDHSTKSAGRRSSSSGFPVFFRYITAAAAILFFSILTIEILEKSTTGSGYNTASIDSFVYEFFTKHNGRHIQPTFQTASLEQAEIFLSENHAVNVEVPNLKSARFQGIVISEPLTGLKIPLLEYHQPENDQYIYIFSFHIPVIEKNNYFIRDSLAIKASMAQTDFQVKDVQGLHIISWKWGDIWYAAISNHNGYELASIIEPLQYELK